METYKPIKVDMDYATRSKLLKSIKNVICNWGQQKTPKNSDGEVIGATAALWLNESTLFFKCFCAIYLITSILFIGVYIFLRFYNNSNILSGLLVRNYTLLNPNATYEEFINKTTIPTNSTEVDVKDVYCMYVSFNQINSIFVLIGGLILFSNFFHMMYLGCYIEYASDKEWFRNLSINSFIWILMCAFIIADFIYSANLISYYSKNSVVGGIFSSTTPKCTQLFQINMYGYLIVAILTAILCIFQIIKIVSIFKKFFLTNYVPHTARCEDENILVMA